MSAVCCGFKARIKVHNHLPMLKWLAAATELKTLRKIFYPLQLIDFWLSLISEFGEKSFIASGEGRELEHEGQVLCLSWQHQGHCSADCRTVANPSAHIKCIFTQREQAKLINQLDNEAFPHFLWHFSYTTHLCGYYTINICAVQI